MGILTLRIGRNSKEFALIETNAPKRYDYGHSIHLLGDDPADHHGAFRLVLVPIDRVPDQTARYSSGLYQSERQTTPSMIAHAESVLIERLYQTEWK